jgi:hypothetical protein
MLTPTSNGLEHLPLYALVIQHGLFDDFQKAIWRGFHTGNSY